MKQYKYKINGNIYNVSVNDMDDNMAHVEVNGTPYKVEFDKPVKAPAKKITRPAAAPKTESGSPLVSRPVTDSKKDAVKSPLPGIVLDIRVKEGEAVKKGQTLIILEAMKMENNINAPKEGKVAAIKVNKGDSVLEGAELVIIE
ncbi:acetyl-CoA carboxylase biotin carboxyl carrier protein subunit [termite gut metagenome]|uniref:Acetyl-CoA carboxylase biotin carboxyl carrier protein subunit n=1 Tax=termite gut metagenome TaxID=433724 RepID=A0A5J4S0S0_9ZZZZ